MSWRRLVAAVLLVAAPHILPAQVVPNAPWRTLRTRHFRVHFTPALELAARRAAVDAEVAYGRLATQLHPPRGPIDLVIADNVDFSNGLTTPFPTNRIVVYAHPPLDVPSLDYYDDWLSVVITHELTHVFHLDRTRGWWRIAQHVFGRAPVLFPNEYAPGWVTEGLATYFETEATGTGRVAGSYERMLVRSTAAAGRLPRFGDWSLATTAYPDGDMAYAYGSRFLDFLTRTRGPGAIGRFVERESGATIPFVLDPVAKRSFGISFTRAWRAWRDSLDASVGAQRRPMRGWRDLTRAGVGAAFPRWTSNGALVYARNDWVATPGAYRVDTSGRTRRIGRRNGSGVNAPFPGGGLLFSQMDYTDPYHQRADLYVQARDGSTRRLTHGARLTQPDARGDGGIIAVRFVPGTTELVRLTARGRLLAVLTPPSLDTEWAAPRWSPHGRRIVATRWTRGGEMAVVILDTLGNVQRTVARDDAVDNWPSWSPDGRALFFTSDRSGATELYEARLSLGAGPPVRVTRGALGVFYPSISPDGRWLSAARYEADGWHIGIAPLVAPPQNARPAAARDTAALPLPAPAAIDSAPAHGYSPWRTLLPRYWLPLVGQTALGNYDIGALTSGTDVVGRHAYEAQILVDPEHGEHEGAVTYAYAGLGQPVLEAAAQQRWDRSAVFDTAGRVVGDLLRRRRTLSVGATFSRPRARSNAFATLAGELDQRAYVTRPDTLLGHLSNYFRSGPRYWAVVGSAGWSDAQRPVRAISAEDGIALSASARVRWLAGAQGGGGWSQSVSMVFDGYKSLGAAPWSSVAHQVLAVRVAAGVAGGANPGVFDVGGTSGENVSLGPGFSIGSYRTFGVRGFPVGARSGTRVVTGSLEYRAPLAAPHRGFGFWPVFLDRTAVTLFADVGTAWGSGTGARFPADWLASVGGELVLDTGLQYDVPYTLRLGAAVPVLDHSFFATPPLSVYVRLGTSF